MDKFQNKYRIASHRLPNWDYSNSALYFITLVAQNRDCILGEIVNDEMILSSFGVIVKKEWEQSFEIRSELFLDEYIIMPNHIHAIVALEKMGDIAVETHGRASLHDRASDYPETHGRVSLHRKPKSISSFVAGFKSRVSTIINNYIDDNELNIPKYNKTNRFFQPNYYDHIIRSAQSLENIRNYIVNNPLNWKNDELF